MGLLLCLSLQKIGYLLLNSYKSYNNILKYSYIIYLMCNKCITCSRCSKALHKCRNFISYTACQVCDSVLCDDCYDFYFNTGNRCSIRDHEGEMLFHCFRCEYIKSKNI